MKIFRLLNIELIPKKDKGHAESNLEKQSVKALFLERIQSEEFGHRFEKMIRWLLFGVVVGFLPFAFPAIKSIVVGPAPTISSIFGRGDLFLITATLVAASFGDLIASGKEQAVKKVIAGFFCLLIFIVCIVWYGVVASALDAGTHYKTHFTGVQSLWIFGFAVVACSGTVILADELKPLKDEGKNND